MAGTISGSQSRWQDHHSSSSASAALVATKNKTRSCALTATGPGLTPLRSILLNAANPAEAGTSSTSKDRPVTSRTPACGLAVHQIRTIASSTVAWSFQAGDSGCAPGAGQPIRSHEQERPDEPGCGWRSGGQAPAQTGQPMAAYLAAASAMRPPPRRRLARSTASTIGNPPDKAQGLEI